MNWYIAVLIITGTFSIAFFIIQKENRHLKALEESIKLVNDVKNKALFYSDSFSKILCDINNSNSSDFLDYIKLFIQLNSEYKNPEKAWSEAVSSSKMPMKSWEKDVLSEFGSKMFSCPKSSIGDYCNNAVEQLTSFFENAKLSKDKNAKTGAIFTISIGIMVVLVLL